MTLEHADSTLNNALIKTRNNIEDIVKISSDVGQFKIGQAERPI